MIDPCRKYLGRYVRVVAIDFLLDSAYSEEVAHGLVFLWIADPFGVLEFRDYAAKLLEIAPLGIMIAGPGARKSFDHLIELLDRPVTLPHTMTSFSTGPIRECLEEFFWATWPSEDRFDEWREYTIAGKEGDLSPLKKSVRKFLAAKSTAE